MDGLEAEPLPEGSSVLNQPSISTVNTENEDQVNHKSAEEEETCTLPKNGVAPEGELMKTDESDTQSCTQEQVEGTVACADSGCHDSTVLKDSGTSVLSSEIGGTLEVQSNSISLDDVVENSPSVLEGTIETIVSFEEVNNIHSTVPDCIEQLRVSTCSANPAPVNEDDLSDSPSSTSKSLPIDSTTTSGISNGPSTPNSDTVSSSLPSSPQTCSNDTPPQDSTSSPYDTDCTRNLISQIQRSLSQESLLDELESELLACQLPEGKSGGERKGSPSVNGLPSDQEGCMMVFEKCVQYKYAQQEKAIQR